MFYQVCKMSIRTGSLPGTWARRNAKILGQVMNSGRLAKLLGVAAGAWSTVAQELAIESKTAVGKTLFGQHLHATATERADAQCDDDSLYFVENSDEITTAGLAAAVKETVETIASFPGSDKIPDRRKVHKYSIDYS